MNRWLYLPDSAIGDLELLSSLDESKVAAFVELVDSEEDRDRYQFSLLVAQALHTGDQKAAEFYNFWDYVYREKRNQKKSPMEVVDEIVSFLRSHPENKYDSLAGVIAFKGVSLLPLFDDFPARDLSKSVRRLEMGPLPHVHHVESVCDIRPVFEKGSERITQFIPIVTMRIGYHDQCGDHHELIVQLTDEGLQSFEKDLKRVRQRLQAIKAPIEDFSPSEVINGKS